MTNKQPCGHPVECIISRPYIDGVVSSMYCGCCQDEGKGDRHMNFAQYRRKRAKVEDARRRHFITPRCEQSLLKILALQLRREGEAHIQAIRTECKEGL